MFFSFSSEPSCFGWSRLFIDMLGLGVFVADEERQTSKERRESVPRFSLISLVFEKNPRVTHSPFSPNSLPFPLIPNPPHSALGV